MYLLPTLNIQQFCHFCVFDLPPHFPPEYLKIKSQASSHFTHNISDVLFTWPSFHFCCYSWPCIVFCLHSIPFSSSGYDYFLTFGNCLLQFDDAIFILWPPQPHGHETQTDQSVSLSAGTWWKLSMMVSPHEGMGLKDLVRLELQKVLFHKWASPRRNNATQRKARQKPF